MSTENELADALLILKEEHDAYSPCENGRIHLSTNYETMEKESEPCRVCAFLARLPDSSRQTVQTKPI